MIKKLSIYLLTISFAIMSLFSTVMFKPGKAFASSNSVVPINWTAFTASYPTDSNAELIKGLLKNEMKYTVNDWYNIKRDFDAQTGTYLSFGGNGEFNVRGPAVEAFSLAVSIKLGMYDETVTGVSLVDAKSMAVKLIGSLAYRHLANTGGGWGNAWQSAFWAAASGQAGFLLWNDLSSTDQEYVRKMVEYEANRFNNYAVPYYKDRAGNVITPGDSKAEENAWNSEILHLAANMMPNHPNANIWKTKGLELSISAFAQPNDVNSTTVVNGSMLSDWLNGSNTANNGTLVNHNLIHPLYMTAVYLNVGSAPFFTLTNNAVPEGILFNADKTYAAYTKVKFTSPPYSAPGGTIYVPNSSNIYYPQGNDWGNAIYTGYMAMDSISDSYNFDTLSTVAGSVYENLHGSKVAEQQARFTTGKTYLNTIENKGDLAEETAAYETALTVLTKWSVVQSQYAITTASPPPVPTLSRLEAENASPSSSGVYVYQDANASGGAGMGSINSAGDSVLFRHLAASSSLVIHYATVTNAQVNLYIDGVFSQTVSFTPTGAYSGPYGSKRVNVSIPENASVKLEFNTGGINFDYIDVDENVALNKTITGYSSQYDATVWNATNINDGTLDLARRGWASTSGSGTRNEWVKIDLGQTYNLSSFTIQSETIGDNNNVKDYVLYGSVTGAFAGEEFILTSGTIPALLHMTNHTVSFAPANARYVKFKGTSSYSNYVIVGELSLYGN